MLDKKTKFSCGLRLTIEMVYVSDGTKRDGEIPPLGEKKQVVGDKPQETAFTDIPLELSDSKENLQESKIPQPSPLPSKPEQPQSFGFRSFLPSFVPLLKPALSSNGLSLGNTTDQNVPTGDSLSQTNRLEILEPELVPPPPRPLNTPTGGDESKSQSNSSRSITNDQVFNSLSSPEAPTISPPPVSSRPPPISNVGQSALSGNPYKLKSVNHSQTITPIKTLGGTPLSKSESPVGSIPLYGLQSAQTPSPNSFNILSGPQIAPKLVPNHDVHNFALDNKNSVSTTIDSSRPPLFQYHSSLNEQKHNLSHTSPSVPVFQLFKPISNTNITDSAKSIYNPNNFDGVDNTVCVSSITTVLTSAGPAPSSFINQEQPDFLPISQSLSAPVLSQPTNIASFPELSPLKQPKSPPLVGGTAETPKLPDEPKPQAPFSQPTNIASFPELPPLKQPLSPPLVGGTAETPKLPDEPKPQAPFSQPTNIASFPELPPLKQPLSPPLIGGTAETPKLPDEPMPQALLSQPTSIGYFPGMSPISEPLKNSTIPQFSEASKLPDVPKYRTNLSQATYIGYFPGISPASEPLKNSTIPQFSEVSKLTDEPKPSALLSQPTNITSFPELPPIKQPMSVPLITRFSEANTLACDSKPPGVPSPSSTASFPEIPPLAQSVLIQSVGRPTESPKLPASDYSQPTNNASFPAPFPLTQPVPTFNYFSSSGNCFPPPLNPPHVTNDCGKTELPSSSFFKPIESANSVCNTFQPLHSLEKEGPVFVNPIPSLPPKVPFPPPNISLHSKIISSNPPKSQSEASFTHTNVSSL